MSAIEQDEKVGVLEEMRQRQGQDRNQEGLRVGRVPAISQKEKGGLGDLRLYPNAPNFVMRGVDPRSLPCTTIDQTMGVHPFPPMKFSPTCLGLKHYLINFNMLVL